MMHSTLTGERALINQKVTRFFCAPLLWVAVIKAHQLVAGNPTCQKATGQAVNYCARDDVQ